MGKNGCAGHLPLDSFVASVLGWLALLHLLFLPMWLEREGDAL